MASHLAKLGVAFIDYPSEAATPEGLLKPEFYAPDRPGVKDAHHANPDYGVMMMRRVLDHLSSRTPANLADIRPRPQATAGAFGLNDRLRPRGRLARSR
jgi:hypothetical protein